MLYSILHNCSITLFLNAKFKSTRQNIVHIDSVYTHDVSTSSIHDGHTVDLVNMFCMGACNVDNIMGNSIWNTNLQYTI